MVLFYYQPYFVLSIHIFRHRWLEPQILEDCLNRQLIICIWKEEETKKKIINIIPMVWFDRTEMKQNLWTWKIEKNKRINVNSIAFADIVRSFESVHFKLNSVYIQSQAVCRNELGRGQAKRTKIISIHFRILQSGKLID